MENLRTESWNVESPVSLETSSVILDSSDNEELNIEVTIRDEDYGFFEIYDIKSGGQRFHCEGGLQFEGKELTDYDGVFELSEHVSNKLKEWGYDVSYVE
jgi:hypothetical protein